MTDAQQREAARQFYYRWNVLGVEDVTQRVEFEKKLIGSKGSTERIDVYIPETRVIIEQKTLGIPLDKPQPGHDNKTPYEQAKGYDNYLPFSERARWIVLSNFADMTTICPSQSAPGGLSCQTLQRFGSTIWMRRSRNR